MFTLKYNSYLPYKQSSEILVRQQVFDREDVREVLVITLVTQKELLLFELLKLTQNY